MTQESPAERRRKLGEAIARAATGDPAALALADELFRDGDYYDLIGYHAAYARLGADQEEVAATRLADMARTTTRAPQTLTRLLNALLDLGPAHFPKAHSALEDLWTVWDRSPRTPHYCIGLFRRPLADVHPVFAPDLVHEALRSLRRDPQRFLPHRTDDWVMRREERVVDELVTGTPEQRAQLATVLAELAGDASLAPLLRHRAVAALERADPAAARTAATELRAAGVEDPGEPVPDPEILEQVDRLWDRIEDALSVKAPHLLEQLGPPLSPYQVSVCRQVIGVPDALAGCLARHRYVWVGMFEGEWGYEDFGRMISDVDEDWWTDDGDWGDLPDLADDAAWLERLRELADTVESGDISGW